MNKIKQLQIALLKEKLEKLTNKKVSLKEPADKEIYDIVQSNKVNEHGNWWIDTPDFQLKYDDKGDFMFSWIYLKTNKYRGADIFKAVLRLAKEVGAKEIHALAAKGVTNNVDATGYFVLVKWGFLPIKGIEWVNKLLGTSYQSFEEAYNDSNFLPMWKQKGQEGYVTFDLTPGSLSMKVFNKYN